MTETRSFFENHRLSQKFLMLFPFDFFCRRKFHWTTQSAINWPIYSFWKFVKTEIFHLSFNVCFLIQFWKMFISLVSTALKRVLELYSSRFSEKFPNNWLISIIRIIILCNRGLNAIIKDRKSTNYLYVLITIGSCLYQIKTP